ncbi:FimB/Mfa2 family fimbrial subunit [Bacteroides uniformis]|uniref:FimB/Mfa2 family fimbrial subunit n=1 Tax=Bacteroides uniformis TaxID=820 RepID=UPI0039B4A8DE
MKARNILHLLPACSLLLILAAACDVKDPIFDTAHPGHGTVTLTTDWAAIGTGLTIPESYTVTAGTDYTATLTGVTNRLDYLFAPGTHRFLVYNTPEHITVSGTTATVSEATGGTGTFIHNAPGWLFYAEAELDIAQDAEHTLTAIMQQHVRELTLILKPEGDAKDRIERIEAYLTGAASTLDFSTGIYDKPQSVELPFTKITAGTHAGSWSATVRLLGTAGPEQRLKASIYFADGNPSPHQVNSDITTPLTTFNTDKRTPLTLDGTVETPLEANFGATITDWETVTGDGPVVAE